MLGVAKDVDAAALKKAFRALALQHHPDRNDAPDAEDKFKEINEAYAVLSDAEKRARYDRFGHEAPGGFGDPFAGMRQGDLRDMFGGDVFEQLFGGFFRRGNARHGKDIHVELELTLEEVLEGPEKDIEFRRPAPCNGCEGTGAKEGTALESCDTCGGRGRVRMSAGFISMVQECPDCRGKGRTILEPCAECHGKGLVQEAGRLRVRIQPGVSEAQRLRVEREGAYAKGRGIPGDLIVHLKTAEHPFFEREGADLHCEVPISFPQATMGASLEVPTLTGKAKVKVPAGTQSGKTLRLRGKGLPHPGNRGRGDQLIRLQMETPSALTKRQKELLAEFESISEGQEGQPRRKSFMDKLKDLFD